jgi:hypothetical protein
MRSLLEKSVNFCSLTVDRSPLPQRPENALQRLTGHPCGFGGKYQLPLLALPRQ